MNFEQRLLVLEAKVDQLLKYNNLSYQPVVVDDFTKTSNDSIMLPAPSAGGKAKAKTNKKKVATNKNKK